MLNNLVSERKRAGLTREEVGERSTAPNTLSASGSVARVHRYWFQTQSTWQSSTDALLTTSPG